MCKSKTSIKYSMITFLPGSMFICRFLSEGTDTTDNPSYLDGINNSIRGCGIVCKSDFLKRNDTRQSQRKNVELLSFYPHRFSFCLKVTSMTSTRLWM